MLDHSPILLSDHSAAVHFDLCAFSVHRVVVLDTVITMKF